jgi:hypothetical protein
MTLGGNLDVYRKMAIFVELPERETGWAIFILNIA